MANTLTHPHPSRTRIRDMALIAVFAVLAIIGGRIVIPLLAIPFTLQFLVCLLTGFLLGGRRALLAQGLYLLLGLIGLPVFALGGGLGYVLQPSFGYLLGMLAAAGTVGFLSQRLSRQELGKVKRRLLYFAIALAAMLINYLFGVSYLYLIRNFYTGDSLLWVRALQIGMLPYLLTDTLHCLLAALIAPQLQRATRQVMADPKASFRQTEPNR